MSVPAAAACVVLFEAADAAQTFIGLCATLGTAFGFLRGEKTGADVAVDTVLAAGSGAPAKNIFRLMIEGSVYGAGGW